MKEFMDKDFLLSNDVAKKLYHDYAENMPIYDYHCHLSPRMIYENYQFSNIGELMLGIALVEMKHYAHIRDAIVALGGTLPKPYDSKNVNIGETPVEALTLAAHSEVATIGFYKSVKERITASTPTADIARKLLTKLIADESLHLKLLTRQLKVMAGDDKKYDELMKKILD